MSLRCAFPNSNEREKVKGWNIYILIQCWEKKHTWQVVFMFSKPYVTSR